ncbi:MAG: DUF1499 domain-containing protein, partial [Planctomycetota bacterium]
LSDDANKTCLQPVSLPQSPEEISESITEWAENRSLWSLVSQSSDGPITTINLTRRTAIMRFVDDVTVEIRALPQGGVFVWAKSQSRVGKGDLGQNPRNLCELTDYLRTLAND